MRALLGLFITVTLFFIATATYYEPTWESINSRPLPSWYDDSKFGIFIHFGLFSTPGYGCQRNAGEWYWWYLDGENVTCINDWQKEHYGKEWKYQDFAGQYQALYFEPTEWATLFVESGAKYVVLTSKHHEGFCNWPSSESWNWNSVDLGPHRDVVDEVSKAVKDVGLHMGLYYSLFEWFNPLYLEDAANNATTQYYVKSIMQPQIRDIVNRYHPEIVWSDGDWMQNDTYWESREFLAWLYNESPVKDIVVVNDRWGINDTCQNGGFWTCSDRYNPGKLINHKWENALTIDKYSWGWRRDANLNDYLTVDSLIYELVSTVSCGGNMLLNVGPRGDGGIDPIFQDRLQGIGQWLKVNGEGIYNTTPWRAQNDTAAGQVWYTRAKYNTTSPTPVYAISLLWPNNGSLILTQPIPQPSTAVELLGYGKLQFDVTNSQIVVQFPNLNINEMPCSYAWTLRLTDII